jgi:D,D-heptose 1,7-bisphosphate phosphatase
MGKRSAAFFDRDGTINVNYGHVYKPADLTFVEGTPEVIRKYNDAHIPVIVVTNQAGIAKGMYTEADMHRFNSHMNRCLREKYNAHIDAFYFCPHHPDYTGECDCRKPQPGMFFRAAKDWNIDLTKSIMYGDKESDKQAAERAGIPRFVWIGERSEA